MTNRVKPKREQRVLGPLVRPDGSRYWACRVDARRRITIPSEICVEQDWHAGDRLEWEVQEADNRKSLLVRNIDALARQPVLRDLGCPREETKETLALLKLMTIGNREV
jgi:bifunctional DNA-binding transcriptional regulator/antitoxin component of YhaV-PrlF toxin-antitoxin module